MADAGLLEEIARFPGSYETKTRADDLAVFQYTSGTTRELPEAVKHTHRALVTLMFAALYGTGVRPGDRFRTGGIVVTESHIVGFAGLMGANSSARPRPPGDTACGTGRWRRWHWVSPPAPLPGASMRRG